MRYIYIISRCIIVMICFVLYLSLVGFDIRHDDGIVGATRKNGDGCPCHNFQSDNGVRVWISGPANVQPGSNNVYTVRVSGGPALTGGFNVATVHGMLSAPNMETKIIGDELTHTHPKSFARSAAQWIFNYQAPATEGYDTLYSVALSSNNDFIPNDVDLWNYGNNFVVRVSATAPPNPVPATSDWGKAILVLLLIATGGWVIARRKSPKEA